MKKSLKLSKGVTHYLHNGVIIKFVGTPTKEVLAALMKLVELAKETIH